MYTVAIEISESFEYYKIGINDIKETLKRKPHERIGYIQMVGMKAAPQTMDLWIDGETEPEIFWQQDGDEEWRELLIDEDK